MKNVRRSHEEKLPWELIEEILSRVPPKSLVCFRTVSTKWNALFGDKTFLKNHKWTFRFVLATKSKIYSVSIDPEIVVRELTLDILGLESQIPRRLVDCNDFLLCGMGRFKGAVVWNPWLKQARVIKSQRGLRFHGIGYDSNQRVKKNDYETIAAYWKEFDPKTHWTIHDFATDAWKDPKSESSDSNQGRKRANSSGNGVSLNGNVYWVAYYDETDPLYHVHEFDFSSKSFSKFCDLPCLKNHPRAAHVLGVFKGDRFSLLKQCHVTKNIEIWVTKNNINNDDDVVWITFMEVSIPYLPDLEPSGSDSQPSYFIDDKRLVVCCCDVTGRVLIYVMEENKLIRKTRIESVVDRWPLHCTYFPSLVLIPQGSRTEAELQV